MGRRAVLTVECPATDRHCHHPVRMTVTDHPLWVMLGACLEQTITKTWPLSRRRSLIPSDSDEIGRHDVVVTGGSPPDLNETGRRTGWNWKR